MKKYKLKELITQKISGEWGADVKLGDAVKVIRTTNFSSNGKINFENIVQRNIENKKVNEKKLRVGDILIEKSGGGPTQPVGRVAFFEQYDNDDYLCNNFTSCLRPNFEIVFPKYLFYRLFNLHKVGKTLRYQNKTTGILNLKLENYLEEEIYIPEKLSEQIQIAEILTQTETLIAQRKESIRLLDMLVKSQFIEMFGDPVKNEKGWEVKRLGDIVLSIDSGWSPVCEDYPRSFESEKAILKLGSVTKCKFDPDANKKLPEEIIEKKLIEIKKGDVLFTRKNTKDLVAAACYVFQTQNNLFLSDLIFRLNYNLKYLNGIFLANLITERKYRKQIQSLATGSAGSMPNISKEKLLNFPFLVPPIKMQIQFAEFVENVEVIKVQCENALREAELLYASLSQKAFQGELVFTNERITLNESKSLESDAAKETKSQPKKQTAEKPKIPKVIELKPTNVDFYKRTVLAAEIVWQLHKEPTFGHLKLQKLLYLCIRTSNMQLPVHFSQQAMGPYDPQLMRSIDKQLREKKWFLYDKDKPLKYEPLSNVGQHQADFQKYYSAEQPNIFYILKKFKTTKSDTVEIVATLFVCLENILQQKEAFSESLLLKKFYDWSDRKKVFDELEVRKVFKKMRDFGILPEGI